MGISRIVTRPVNDVSKGLSLTFDGEQLRTPYIVSLRIANIGSREIVSSVDYQEPLVIKFDDDAKCYEAVITRTSGTTLKQPTPVISQPAASFEIVMPTLNEGSWVELEMVVDGERKYPHLSCLLVGETLPIGPILDRRRMAIKSSSLIGAGLGVFLGSIGFFLMGLQAYTDFSGPSAWAILLATLGSAVFVVGVVAWATCLWLDRQQKLAIKRAIPNVFN